MGKAPAEKQQQSVDVQKDKKQESITTQNKPEKKQNIFIRTKIWCLNCLRKIRNFFILLIVILILIFVGLVAISTRLAKAFNGTFLEPYVQKLVDINYRVKSLTSKTETGANTNGVTTGVNLGSSDNTRSLGDKLSDAFSNTYSADNEPIVKVVKQMLPGVVSIAIEQPQFVQGPMVRLDQAKIGSGFVIDSSGIIVTNRHVVSANSQYNYKVITADGKSLQVVKVLEDPVNDLAFVFVHPNNVKLQALKLGNSDNLQLGQTVIAIGTPFGQFPSTVTSGIISGLHRKVSADASLFASGKTYSNVIQTDAPINPGNSGGPLINLAGEVIGINFAKINGGDNISFALPINLVKTRLSQYKEYGHFRQAFLGVSVRHLDVATASYYSVPAGDLVVQVVPNSPADKAGIKVNDIIVKIDDISIADNSVLNVLSNYKVGQVVNIELARPEKQDATYKYTFKTIKVKVKLADRYDFFAQ